jgi:acetyl/propionyl-CoA carboxylase alpha subunit
MPFTRVLVANRGEIAVRVIQTLQEMGIRAVAVYSDPDRDAPHVRLADEAYPLPGRSAAETYLDQERIAAVAREARAEAVHPGYGFLSENPAFAARLEAAGVQLIGPPARVIALLGDKVAARRVMEAAGVPVVPGWSGEIGKAAAVREVAQRLGYPLLVKAAAGGGGKGMRRVDAPAELDAALASAAGEAERAFGDRRLFLERWLPRPRHVEIQVFGDTHGGYVHLFERECSIQRRHQKIVEESPSPALDAGLRERMAAAALQAARAAGYVNAGTVEFLLDATGSFYFLEVNTRLQVEHPVTELVSGADLVRAQVLVAAGERLPFRQEELSQSGHALECRIYAEDPARDFLPSTGVLQVYREPRGPGIRVDSGVREGMTVTADYDPLLAKLVVWAETRPQALAKLAWALDRYVVLGLQTNLVLLRRLIHHPDFVAGDLHTGFLQEHAIPLAPPTPTVEVLAAAALAETAGTGGGRPAGESQPATPAARRAGPWLSGGPWRLNGCRD